MNEEEVKTYHLQLFPQSEIFPLMPLLKKGILHTTGIDGNKRIRETGQILPNVDGKFPFYALQLFIPPCKQALHGVSGSKVLVQQ